MPRLPENPSLEHLKSQAKTLLQRAKAGDEAAAALMREHHPDPPPGPELRLADAQLSVARAYGFPSWPKLRAHLEVIGAYSRSPHKAAEAADPADEFLRLACLTYSSDDPARWEAAKTMLAARPEIARASLHVAAAAGNAEAARELLGASHASLTAGGNAAAGDAHAAASDANAAARDVQAAGDARATGYALRAVNEQGGPHRWEPLLYLAYSRAAGDGSVEVARLLLAAGADANAGYLWEGLPSPFTALTGALGRGEGDPPPHRDGLALARLLLEAGADANDTQATYNLSWTPGDEWLELLLEFGYGRGDGGPWHARLAPAHPTPRENAEDCLTWAARYGFPSRIRLLLDAGVDPDGRGTRHPILEGRTALGIAIHEGHEEAARLLRDAGAAEPELGAGEQRDAAWMRADETVTGAPPAGLLVRAASNGNAAAVRLMLARGADVNARHRATALHEAALRGDLELVELLLDHGADPGIHDTSFDATPAGWAEHAGHEALAELLRSREG